MGFENVLFEKILYEVPILKLQQVRNENFNLLCITYTNFINISHFMLSMKYDAKSLLIGGGHKL